MRRDAGIWMLAAIVLLFVLLTFWILGRAVWQAPEIRDVPPTATVTRVPMTVLPEQPVIASPTLVPAPTLEPTEVLPRVTSTSVPPTETPVPTAEPTVVPTSDKPPVQRG